MNILFYNPSIKTDNWLSGIKKRLPDANVRFWQEGDSLPADYALVWKPPHTLFTGLRNLKAIFILGAGVDAVLAHERAHPGMLPVGVPLIRLEDTGMAKQMEEYVIASVFRYFRRFDDYSLQQQQAKWQYLPPYRYEEFVIGVMGLGVLGCRVAQTLAALGFKVKGLSYHKKQVEFVDTYSQEECGAFLSGVKVLINLLPNTPQTEGILSESLFEQLEKGAFLINIARGAHLVEDDLLNALASEQLAAATLDVFMQEPLPQAHPFWRHKKITLTPHISAVTLPEMAIEQVCYKIEQLEQGKAVSGVVDLNNGY